MWIACGAKPGLVVEAGGFDDQRIVSLPMPDGISVPRGIWIFGKSASIGPDRAPGVFAFEELNDPVVGLNELKWRGEKHNARETGRITLQDGIITIGHGPRSVSWLLGGEPHLRPRRHRRHIPLRCSGFLTAGALVEPDAGDVALSGGRRGFLAGFF